MLERLKESWNLLNSCGFLSSSRMRSFFLYTKEPLEELMYGSMIRKPWFLALSASPIYLVMMPMFSFILIGLALIDIYELIKAEDKNIDRWLNAVIGSICASLATTSITLYEITLLTGIVFPVGPWFFLSSVLVFSCNALFQTGLNFWRTYHSPPGSQQRLNHLQTAINWTFISATVLSVVGCVFFVILFPNLCVTAGAICATSTVALTTMSLLWRMAPKSFKHWLKQRVGLEHYPVNEIDISVDTHVAQSQSITKPYILNESKESQGRQLNWCFSTRCFNTQSEERTESEIHTNIFRPASSYQ